MTEREDNRLVEYLYGELPAKDAAAYERVMENDPSLKNAAAEMRDVLSQLREIDDEEPSPHLDALVLANARQLAEQQAKPLWRRLIASPMIGLAAAGSVAVVLAVIALPNMKSAQDEAPLYPPIPARTGAPAEGTAKLEAPPEVAPAAPANTVAQPETDAEKAAGDLFAQEDTPQDVLRDRARGPRVTTQFPADEPLAKRRVSRGSELGGLSGGAGVGTRASGEARGGADLGGASGKGYVETEKAKLDEASRSKKEDTDKKPAVAETPKAARPAAKPAERKAEPPAEEAPSAGTKAAPAAEEEPKAADLEVADRRAEQDDSFAAPAPSAEPPPPPASVPMAGASAPAKDAAETSGRSQSARRDELASSAIATAEQKLAAKDVAGARKVLLEAFRTKGVAGTRAGGTILLRLARLELAERQWDAAIRYARQASAVSDAQIKAEAKRIQDSAEAQRR